MQLSNATIFNRKSGEMWEFTAPNQQLCRAQIAPSEGAGIASSVPRYIRSCWPVCFNQGGGYFPLLLFIALRICASASSLQYLQFNCKKTDVYGTVMFVFKTTM
jgi:hypothetical protein